MFGSQRLGAEYFGWSIKMLKVVLLVDIYAMCLYPVSSLPLNTKSLIEKMQNWLTLKVREYRYTKGNLLHPPKADKITAFTLVPPEQKSCMSEWIITFIWYLGRPPKKRFVLIFLLTFLYCCFLASWLDVSNLDSPTELQAATQGISTIALILGLILAGLVAGVIAIWRKLKVGLSIHW